MFNSEDSFERRFPEIEAITVEARDDSHLVKYKKEQYFTKKSICSLISCNNPVCEKKSGINIEPIISDMVSKNETYRDDYGGCNGIEGNGRDCTHTCIIKINIKYKESLAE